MSLDLRQVLPQVEALGRETARRADELLARLPATDQLLSAAAALDPDELRRRLAAAPPAVHPAWPTDERIDRSFGLPEHAPRLRIVAADGSQIYPDRHGAAFFYLVNVGSIDLVHGSGRPPEVHTQTRLHFNESEVHDSRGLPVDTHLVNARRDAAEMAELARLVAAPILSGGRSETPAPSAEPGLSGGEGLGASAVEGPALSSVEGPTLAVLDNGLLLWAASQEQKAARPDVERVLGEYLAALDRLRDSGAAVAGYISRPRGAHVVALAEAAAETPPVGPSGLSDRLLFGRRLQPGERGARFGHPVKLNEVFAERGHQIQFFYLHTGAQDGIARIEIPAWVADDPARLAAVHAGLVEQCRVTGIPYPLVRAHELALVGQDDRRALDDLVAASLANYGLSSLPSQKAQTKRWTQRRRRHRV